MRKRNSLYVSILIALILAMIIAIGKYTNYHGTKHHYVCGTHFVEENRIKNNSGEDSIKVFNYIWYEELDSISQVSNAIRHYCSMAPYDSRFKTFNSKGDKNFYYNDRHGYYIILPEGMGYNQSGENIMGAHSNEFYNEDTTLVISAFALYYDVLLDDYPHYEDTMRNDHIKYLQETGEINYITKKKNKIVAKLRVNKDNPDNPPSDYMISKWIIKKDIDDRECEMVVNIWYNDSNRRREKELFKIVNTFPNKPFK